MTEWLSEHRVVLNLLVVGILLLGAWLSLAIVRRYLLAVLAALVRRTKAEWDEVLLQRRVFHRLSWAVPILIVQQGIRAVPDLPDGVAGFVQRFADALFILVAVRVFAAVLAAANDVYLRHPVSSGRPIKGYLQVLSVAAHCVAAIFIVAKLMDRNPAIFIGGLGAMSAVLLLIFRDSLLSLVAGIQLTSNDLIRVGDWIEMPQFMADGDVIDIALNSVTVQNWDKTVTVIPTHKFLEHSFKNWRGMKEAGGRRIKRAINIDMTTIRFLDAEEVDRFGRFALLRDYIARKKAELEEHNRRVLAADPGAIVNARRLTNIGTFRAYVVEYLRSHPLIRKDMTFLVRQLEPTPQGLPIEIYVFAADTVWANYENIQADIFDHLLAMVPEFGLSVYQQPSGRDFREAFSVRAMQTA